MSCLAWPSIECRTFHIIYEAFHHRCLQQRAIAVCISSGTDRQLARQGILLACRATHARCSLLCFGNASCIYTTALMHYCKQIMWQLVQLMENRDASKRMADSLRGSHQVMACRKPSRIAASSAVGNDCRSCGCLPLR